MANQAEEAHYEVEKILKKGTRTEMIDGKKVKANSKNFAA